MEIVVVVPDLPNGGNINELPPRAVGYWLLAIISSWLLVVIASKLSFRRKSKSPLYFLVKPYVIITYVV